MASPDRPRPAESAGNRLNGQGKRPEAQPRTVGEEVLRRQRLASQASPDRQTPSTVAPKEPSVPPVFSEAVSAQPSAESKANGLTTEEKVATVFQVLDLVHEDDNPAQKEARLDAAILVAQKNGLVVDEATIKRLLETHTTNNITPERLGQGLQLIEQFRDMTGGDMVNDPNLPQISTREKARDIMPAVESLYEFVQGAHKQHQNGAAKDSSEAREASTVSSDRLPAVKEPVVEAEIVEEEPDDGLTWKERQAKQRVRPLFESDPATGLLIQKGVTVHFEETTVIDRRDGNLHVYDPKFSDTPFPIKNATLRVTGDNREWALILRKDPNDPKDLSKATMLGRISLHNGEFQLGTSLPAQPATPALEQGKSNEVAIRPQGAVAKPEPADPLQSFRDKPDVYFPALPTRPAAPEYPDPIRRPGMRRFYSVLGSPLAPDSPHDDPSFWEQVKTNIRSDREDITHRRRTRRGEERGRDTGFAEFRDLQKEGYIVGPNPGGLERTRRFVYGGKNGYFAAGAENRNVYLIGPMGSGKTETMKYMLTHYTDSAIVISSKPDFLNTLPQRAQTGYIEVYAPFGFGEGNEKIAKQLEPYVRTYSHVAQADTWGRAQFIGRTMTETSQKSPTVRAEISRSQEAGYWNSEAELVLPGMMYAVNKSGGNMEMLLDIAFSLTQRLPGKRGEPVKFKGVEAIKKMFDELEAKATDPQEQQDIRRARQGVDAFADKEERPRSSVAGVINTILHAYNRDALRDAAKTSELDPARLTREKGTLYCIGTSSDMADAGYYFADIAKLVTKATQDHQELDPDTYRHLPAKVSTAVFVDEVAQLPELPIRNANESRIGTPYVMATQQPKLFEEVYGDLDKFAAVADGLYFRGSAISPSIQQKVGTYPKRDHSGDFSKWDTSRLNPRFRGEDGNKQRRANVNHNKQPKYKEVPKIDQNYVNGQQMDGPNLGHDQVLLVGLGGLVAELDKVQHWDDKDAERLEARKPLPTKSKTKELTAEQPTDMAHGKEVALPTRSLPERAPTRDAAEIEEPEQQPQKGQNEQANYEASGVDFGEELEGYNEPEGPALER